MTADQRPELRARKTWRGRMVAPAVVALAVGLSAAPAAGARKAGAFGVGVLSDGPLARPAKAMLEQIEREVKVLLGDKSRVLFATERRVAGDWTRKGVAEGLDRLLADSAVDLIVAVGPIATAVAAGRASLAKPILSPLAIDPALSGLPSDEQGRSGKRNFSYLTYPSSLVQDLQAFRELVDSPVIHFLYDRTLLVAVPKLVEATTAAAARAGVRIVGIPSESSADRALQQIPADAKAVFFGPLTRMSGQERQKLFAGLQSRRLPSFTTAGREELLRGVLATQTREVDGVRVVRRSAANIVRAMRGDDPARFSLHLQRNPRLLLNMAVARAIAFSPGWNTLIYAELVNDAEAGAGKRALSLGQAMKEALRRNLDLRATRAEVTAGAQRILAARSKLWPQLDFLFTHRTVREEVAEASFGSTPQHEGRVAGQLRQFLFVEPVLADITVQKRAQQARDAGLEGLKLDIAGQTAVAYLTLLRNQTIARIEKSNAMLTAENLEQANVRRRVGVGGPSDVYRWQSQLAVDRRRAIAARAEVQAALVLLNQLLRRPQAEMVAASTPSEHDPTLLPRFKQLRPFLKTPRRFALFSDFVVKEGLEAAPELRQLRATVGAQRRFYESRARALYLPQVEIQGEVSHQVYRHLAEIDGPDLPFELDSPRFRWFIGAALALPIFTGLQQTAEKRRARHELEQLELQRGSTELKIESRIRAALARSRSADAGIDLAAQSATAARKNLGVVTDAYARGAANAVTLLDAQNNALISDLAEATAVFDYLLSIVELQRASGRFELFVSSNERDAWFARLREHFEAANQAVH